MRGCSRYNTITKQLIEVCFEWILSNLNVKPPCVSSYVVTVINPESNQKEFPPKC